MDIPIVPPPPPRPMSSRSQRALSTRLPDSVRPAMVLDGKSGLTSRQAYIATIDSPIDEFQLAWLNSGNHQDSLKKIAADEQHDQRKQEVMTEQVLSDQLSRYVLSDIEQEEDRHKPFALQQQPRRNLDRRMHDTRFSWKEMLFVLHCYYLSRVKTSNSLTENLLSKRIRFSCRILTRSVERTLSLFLYYYLFDFLRDGKDALRDLFGFYFMLDRTLAIYEYRILGKR